MKKVLLLNSGGLDSACVGKWLNDQGYEAHSLFINTHVVNVPVAAVAAEETARRYCQSHHVIDIDFGQTGNSWEDADGVHMYDSIEDKSSKIRPALKQLPNVTMVVLAVGCSYGKMIDALEVYSGHKTNTPGGYADRYNEIANLNTYQFLRAQLILPVWDKVTYTDLLNFAGVEDIQDFSYTHSCVWDEPCGRCFKCVEREELGIL